jgi:hypothetical protein
MKKRLYSTAIICCLCIFSAMAVQKTYFSQTLTGDLSADGWTVTGATVVGTSGTTIVKADGGDVVYTRAFTDTTYFNDAYFAVLGAFIAGTNSGDATYKAQVVVESTNNEVKTFDFDGLIDSPSKYQLDTVQGSADTILAPIASIKVIFKSLNAGVLVAFKHVSLFSDYAKTIYHGSEQMIIQAENYDDGGPGVAYYTRRSDGPSDYREDSQGACVNGPNDIFQNNYCIENMGESWTTYNLGEYINSTTNEISPEMAQKNWGVWYKYTVDVARDCYVDISVRTGCHWGSYGIISHEGARDSYKKDRSAGGYVVTGMDEDWVHRYSASYVFKLDEKDMKGYQLTRPVWAQDGNLDNFKAVAGDSSKWTSTVVNGVNNDTIWCWPMPDNPSTWASHYGSKPEFQNVHLTQGKHVFRIQSLASQFFFDEFKIEPAANPGAVESVDKDNYIVVASHGVITITGNSNPADVYSIAGVLVSHGRNSVEVPQGIYIVKVGSVSRKIIVTD